ncbi:MAG: Tex family protein [Bacteroidota bacterium]
MEKKHIERIAQELNVRPQQVAAAIRLLDEGATVPFISRYRKEVTGSLDEVQIAQVRDRIEALRALDKRRESILTSLIERELLTDELKSAILGAQTLSELEDIYLPFRPKRRTRATIARERGLEPLATQLLEQDYDLEPESLAQGFINPEKEVGDLETALKGARDIIAETINEHQEVRSKMRQLYARQSMVHSKVIKGKEEEGAKYKDYFDWSEPLAKVPSHRLLAMRRGEKESILSLTIEPAADEAHWILEREFVKNDSPAASQVRMAAEDCYKRLLGPSMETEVRITSKDTADEEAIKVFTDNLRELLLAAPLGEKRVLALDPGFRTGCKVVALSAQGKLLHNTTIYPNPPQRETVRSEYAIIELVKSYNIEAIAIGNGTASRETERFLREIELPKNVQVLMVNESGASVYSASEVARNEFPDYDITVRGAVSIGRRLMDPLAELVKIDPKSIGVGQYQHDVDQTALKKSLDDTVMSCVNAVGVELNTASKELLTYVSGLGPVLAQNIVQYRNENGPFSSRKSLTKVPRLGPKAFEQAAGFLRVREADNPLDRSAVHPESYHVVEQMAKDLGVTLAQLMSQPDLVSKLSLQRYVTDTIGIPTLKDIVEELKKPGRDPREQFEAFSFDESVNKPEDLRVGMWLPGIVTNVADFGAFVDVGVHQDGLVHKSQMANRFVKHPSEVVKVQQKVNVRVVSLDLDRNRIGLSLIEERKDAKPRHAGGKGRRGGNRDRNSGRRDSSSSPTLENNEFFQVKKQQRKKK